MSEQDWHYNAQCAEAQFEAEVERLRKVRLCREHFSGPDSTNYGEMTCMICLLNRAEAAEAEVERLTRECLDRETDARERLRRCEERLAAVEALADSWHRCAPATRNVACTLHEAQVWHSADLRRVLGRNDV